MAEQRIQGRDGTVTVVSDSYGATVYTGPASPQEDPSKWVRKDLREEDVLKRYKWTKAQLTTAQAYLGFPTGRKVMTTSEPPRQRQAYYLDVIKRWDEHAAECGLGGEVNRA